MQIQQFVGFRGVARAACLVNGVLLAVAFSLVSTASAALIVDAIGYDGSVKNGMVTGVEEHETTTNFPPPSASIALPATNPPLTSPLLPSKNLTMTATTAQELFPSPGGILYNTLIVQISSPTGDVFANPLDTSLMFPVQAEFYLFSNTPGMKAVVNPANIGIENFDLPPFSSPAPGSYTVSGLGTQANPLHIQLGLKASQVDDQNGFVKFHLRYSEMLVPEPSSFAVLVIGLVGLLQAARSRRQ